MQNSLTYWFNFHFRRNDKILYYPLFLFFVDPCGMTTNPKTVNPASIQPPQTKNKSSIYSPSDIPFSEKTLSDEVFLQYLHDSPPIDKLFVFYSIFWIILLI